MKKQIREAAQKLNIPCTGFATGSVVAIFPYFVADEQGNLSMYARGRDYHTLVREKLQPLADFLKELGATNPEIHVDNGPLNDRAAAHKAGLGFYGQNGMLINPEFGSYFFIGQITHDLDIEPDGEMAQTCIDCGRCERECPGGALRGGKVDTAKCLSEITQKKGELSEGEAELIKKQRTIWGCDVCQRVCPHNRGLKTTALPEFMASRLHSLEYGDVAELSNREFKEKYGGYAFSWRGKGPLLRNLEILEDEYEQK